MKKKILYCGEASYIKSGYGAYARELLSRLHDSGKYEVIEFASSGTVNNKDDRNIKWKYYANAVDRNDPRYQAYTSNPNNNNGYWRFERLLVEEKPDVVFAFRDPWVDSFITQSPFRRFFKFVWMPTCDSTPVKEEFIEAYKKADIILGYTDWQVKILKELGLTNVYKSAPHCPTKSFFPVPKKQHKEKLGLDSNSLILGTVMRNQKRKLFPDLMEAFSLYLNLCEKEGNTELAKRSFLYLHTSYPDLHCWELPTLLKTYGLGNKTLFTYKCGDCKNPFISFFQDARTICPHCRHAAAVLPNVGSGVTDEELNYIYNVFDAYVQYSNCEGFGLPIIEAAACGIPVFGVDYSAPSDIITKLNGTLIPADRMFWSLEEGSQRAMPNNQYFAERLYELFNQPEGLRNRVGDSIRENAKAHYDWEKTVQVWMDCFDSLENNVNWNESPRLYEPNLNLQATDSHYTFVTNCFLQILYRPDLLNSYLFNSLVSDLNYGITRSNGKITKFTREMLVDYLVKLRTHYNNCEMLRTTKQPTEDWIEYANLKERANKL